jgi:RNA polymerase subunit RPABC4/transcription elongation factor Spt4
MTDLYPREGEAICKACAMPHVIDEWRGVKFYICPETERVYLVAKEKKSE